MDGTSNECMHRARSLYLSHTTDGDDIGRTVHRSVPEVSLGLTRTASPLSFPLPWHPQRASVRYIGRRCTSQPATVAPEVHVPILSRNPPLIPCSALSPSPPARSKPSPAQPIEFSDPPGPHFADGRSWVPCFMTKEPRRREVAGTFRPSRPPPTAAKL